MAVTQVLTHKDEAAVRALLVGRRIVAAEIDEFEVPGYGGFVDSMPGRLTLDDGTVVYVSPNAGCGGCEAGNYGLTHLVSVDNIITSVRLACEVTDGGSSGWADACYRIFVVADAVEINAVTIEGTDGNGWYGTGYDLRVVAPTPSPSGQERTWL